MTPTPKPLKLTKANVSRMLKAEGFRPYRRLRRQHLTYDGFEVWGDAHNGWLYVCYVSGRYRNTSEIDRGRELFPKYRAALVDRFTVTVVDSGQVNGAEWLEVRAKEASR